jgi:ABC-2 type transport system permease protein
VLRVPALGLPFLLMPVPIYLFFGVVLAGQSPEVQSNPELRNYLFSGWCAFSVMGPALFGVACSLAVEREGGLLRLKRALPVPAGGYLVAKLVVGMAFSATALATLLVAAPFVDQMSLSAGQLAALAAVMVVGSLPFAAIGLFIGAYASGSSAPAFANLVFLPMLWLSGLFFPLPAVLERWVVIWPSFHLNQLALAAAGVSGFTFIDPKLALAVLVGVTVLLGGLALRRLARVG